jgi:hypothetical protein
MNSYREHEPGTFTVLMTACIEPKAGVRESLRRSDASVRLSDYKDGLAFWLTLPDQLIGGIVFADNSNYPLRELEESAAQLARADRPVEFLSFDFPAPNPNLSYGHSEFLLINRAMERSELLRNGRYFIKATGRYRFPGISRLLRRLPHDFIVAVDSKGFRPFGLRSEPMSCVALTLFDRQFYEATLSGIPAAMVPAPPWNRQQFVEHVLFDALYPRRADPRVVMRWPCNCEPVGVGSNGDDYRRFRKRLQQVARAASRRLWPGLWI